MMQLMVSASAHPTFWGQRGWQQDLQIEFLMYDKK
jgi:hypothetical protein